MREKRQRINTLVDRKNGITQLPRTRTNNQRLEKVKRELKIKRKKNKKKTLRWEREWWDGKITVCEEANNEGNTGKMYKLLREVGAGQSIRAQQTITISDNEFKEYFEKLLSGDLRRVHKRSRKRQLNQRQKVRSGDPGIKRTAK